MCLAVNFCHDIFVTSETSAQVLNNSFMYKRMAWHEFKNSQ